MNKNLMIYGDAIEEMEKLPSSSVEMILADLPYGKTRAKWDSIIPTKPMWSEFKRLLKTGGAVVLTAQQPFTSLLVSSNLKWFRYAMVWEKSKATGFLNAKKRPLVAHEDILVFCEKPPPYFPQMKEGTAYNKGLRKGALEGVYNGYGVSDNSSQGGRYPRSVVYFKTAESEGKTIHISQKPVALFKYLIKTYSAENDLVLDCSSGSGTTAVACLQTNRNYICIENDKKFFAKSLERLENY